MDRVLIVGGGHAGFNFVDALVREGFEGDLTLVHEEQDLPYDRTTLSKEFIMDTEKTVPYLRSETFYDENSVRLIRGRVDEINRRNQLVSLSDGSELSYDKLVLALGAEPRNPFVAEGAEVLRDVTDARRLRDRLQSSKRVGIVGGGFIGLELASAAAQQGKTVQVFEIAPRILSRSVSKELSTFLTEQHRSHGVQIHTNVQELRVTSSETPGAYTVGGSNIPDYPCDLLITGIGAYPRTELAAVAGLAIENGIKVDSQLRTSDPNIFAIGDCASYPRRGLQYRPENIQSATDQVRFLATQLVGNSSEYGATPWFWSIQYGHRIQIVGAPSQETRDEVVLNTAKEGSFSVFRWGEEGLVAVESVNDPKTHVLARNSKLHPPLAAN